MLVIYRRVIRSFQKVYKINRTQKEQGNLDALHESPVYNISEQPFYLYSLEHNVAPCRHRLPEYNVTFVAVKVDNIYSVP